MVLQSMELSPGPLDEEMLKKHETAWGFRLPEQYRQFLLTYNGGRPEPFCFKFKGKDTGSSIHSFLGLSGDRNRDLLKSISFFKNRLPARFIPVAYDDGGNQICISIAGDDCGKVFFWHHEWEANRGQGESPETIDNVTLIADSFEEFLNGLHELHEG